MGQPLKGILITVGILLVLLFLLGIGVTALFGDRAYDYTVSYDVFNKTSDTLYIEKPCCPEKPDTGLVYINGAKLSKVMPGELINLLFEEGDGSFDKNKDLLNNFRILNILVLKNRKDTIEFNYADEKKCEITEDDYHYSIIRIID